MPDAHFIRKLLLPELRFVHLRQIRLTRILEVEVVKTSEFEVCPRCAHPSSTVYDHRMVRIRDAPVRDFVMVLLIRKRRLFCAPCQKPFTEPVDGVRKGFRHSERYGRSLLHACETYSDLSRVRRDFRCSAGLLYTTLYRHLELERRKRLYPWPAKLGIDEHFFRRGKGGFRDFVSVIVDQKNRRLMEVVEGRTSAELEAALDYIPGRENVRMVALDLCDPFKHFARRFFPNAHLVADKFHVLRLLTPAINRHRKLITGDRRSLPVRRLLLRNGRDLDARLRWALRTWLTQYPALRELYETKERLSAFYRIRSHRQAARVLTEMTDAMASSVLPEIQTFRRTLMKWRAEVLAYFWTRLTNGITEGFNCKAKLVKRRAFGYRSFRNYRLRLLNACA